MTGPDGTRLGTGTADRQKTQTDAQHYHGGRQGQGPEYHSRNRAGGL